jgi:hypothetical protein
MFQEQDSGLHKLDGGVTDAKIQALKSRIEDLEERLTWIERLLMNEGRELFSDTATQIRNWTNKDV